MKKILTTIFFLIFLQANALRYTGISLPLYGAISDSAFNYLQGEWVQSYRADIYFMPFCETACYPLFNSCYADFYKFEIDPVKISYQKLNDSTGAIIKSKGSKFYSEELNKSFLNRDSIAVDTIFLTRKSDIRGWRVDTIRNRSNILLYFNWQMEHTHFYNFFTEDIKVVFERTKHRKLGKYITENIWFDDICSLSAAIICKEPYNLPMHFFLKNDTIYSMDPKSPQFVYDYRGKQYRSLVDKNITLELSKDSLQLYILNGDAKQKTYFRAQQMVLLDKSKYLGVWTSTSTDRVLEITQNNDSLYMMNHKEVSDIENKQLRIGNVVEIPAVYPANTIPQNFEFAFFKSDAECTPSYSRFELQNNDTELVELYTGEVYQKTVVTNLDFIAPTEQKVSINTNPIHGGILKLIPEQSYEYEIYRIGGNAIGYGSSNDKGEINIQNLKPATYVLKITTEKSVFADKFVIE